MNKNFFKLTLALSIIRFILFISLIIWLNIKVAESIKLGQIKVIEKIITISFCFSLVLIIFLLLNVSLFINYFMNNFLSYKIIIFLSILSLNIEILIITFKNWNKKFTKIRLSRITVFDLTAISTLLAMYFLFAYITTFIPTTQFFFIELSFKYLPLFFGAFILNRLSSFILCFLAACLTSLLPGVYIDFWQFFFDYWLTAFSIFFASFFQPTLKANKWYTKIAIWFTFVSVPIIIIYFSRVTAGVVFWLNPNKNEQIFLEFDWSSIVGYSFIYNSVNTIFDYVMLIILIPSLCESLWVIKEKIEANKANMN